jgi:hypothetical protein
MSKKCKHKNIVDKYTRGEKYGESVLVSYTYCADCGEIFKGSAKFVDPIDIPISRPEPINLVNTPETPRIVGVESKSSVSRKDASKAARVSKAEVKEDKVKKIPVNKTKEQKVINKKPRRGDSGLRKNTRKPSASKAPSGASLGDILRAKYSIKDSKIKQAPPRKIKTKYTPVEDPYSSSFEDAGDVEIFLK